MIRVTHKTISRLIRRDPGYVRLLLFRKGIALKQEYVEQIFDLVAGFRKISEGDTLPLKE